MSVHLIDEVDRLKRQLAAAQAERDDARSLFEKTFRELDKALADKRKLAEDGDALERERDAQRERADRAEAERERLRQFLSDGQYQGYESELAWKRRAEVAEAQLDVARAELATEEAEHARTLRAAMLKLTEERERADRAAIPAPELSSDLPEGEVETWTDMPQGRP